MHKKCNFCFENKDARFCFRFHIFMQFSCVFLFFFFWNYAIFPVFLPFFCAFLQFLRFFRFFKSITINLNQNLNI